MEHHTNDGTRIESFMWAWARRKGRGRTRAHSGLLYMGPTSLHFQHWVKNYKKNQPWFFAYNPYPLWDLPFPPPPKGSHPGLLLNVRATWTSPMWLGLGNVPLRADHILFKCTFSSWGQPIIMPVSGGSRDGKASSWIKFWQKSAPS